MIPAFLINLDRSPDRLAAMHKEFGRVNVPFVRVAGIDAKRFTPDELTAYFAARSFSEDRLPGDAGAFMSHLEVWRMIAEGDAGFGAVFEDDVHLASDLPTLLASPQWIPADADLVRLEANNKMVLRHGRRIEATPRRKVFRAMSSAWGAAGYIISRATAQRFVSLPASTHTHIDWFLFKPTRSPVAASLTRYQVLPTVCIQDQVLNGANSTMKSIVSHGIREPSAPRDSSVLHWIFPNKKRPVYFLP